MSYEQSKPQVIGIDWWVCNFRHCSQESTEMVTSVRRPDGERQSKVCVPGRGRGLHKASHTTKACRVCNDTNM